MERSGGSAATLTVGGTAPETGRGASLSIRLSAVIIAATISEPRVLTVRIGDQPITTRHRYRRGDRPENEPSPKCEASEDGAGQGECREYPGRPSVLFHRSSEQRAPSVPLSFAFDT